MAIKFFWTCEATTLGADDFSAGDTTASVNGSPTLNAAAARVGTLGILAAANARYYVLDSASIVNPAIGAMGGSIRVSGNPTSGAVFMRALGTDTGNHITFGAAASGLFRVQVAELGTTQTSTLTAALTPNAWHGFVIRWDLAGNRRAVELYDASGALIEAVSAGLGQEPTELTVLRFGNVNTTDITSHMDNVFVSDDPDEPIQNNFTIANFAAYDAGGSHIAALARYYHSLRPL